MRTRMACWSTFVSDEGLAWIACRCCPRAEDQRLSDACLILWRGGAGSGWA